MTLLRFQSPDKNKPVDILERLKSIKQEDIKNTILLLDGLDEDPFIISRDSAVSDEEAFNKRIDQIVSATRIYKDVVITCRTQYFPQQETDAYELHVRKPDGKGMYKLQKYYIFPFSDSDIQKYLDRKYGVFRFWNTEKKKSAQLIAKDNKSLLARPMLMNYIDYLVEENNIYTCTSQVYHVLIEKWLKREADKWKSEAEKKAFIDNLRKLSMSVALEIYHNWRSDGKLSIPKNRAKEIADEYNITLSADEVHGKSLLTCDAYLNWKFAHKSILEYFIAKQAAEDTGFAVKLQFAGMNMTRKFCSEFGLSSLIESNYVLIRGDEFTMGSPKHEVDRSDNETEHQVKLSDYYLCKYAVTVADFKRFAEEIGYTTDAETAGSSSVFDGKAWNKKVGINWRHGVSESLRSAGEYNHPVLHVSWNDAVAYAGWLSLQTGKSFRLPTEAEWEYACRAGKGEPFSTGENLTTDQANYDGNYPYNGNRKGVFRGTTIACDALEPNALGLYNMHGNVWEWCSDRYGDKYYDECKAKGIVENPVGPETGSLRVLRGGSWFNYARICRSAYRDGDSPDYRSDDAGFRLAFVP